MGLYDRDYTQDNFGSRYGRGMSHGGAQLLKSFFWITPIVKKLIIINIAVFLLCILNQTLREFIYTWFSSYSNIPGMLLQPWRIVTYQFLHETARGGHIVFRHLLGNMFGLFFFGRFLERHFGSRRFLIFYLLCGAVGGAVYPILASLGWVSQGYLIGASGSVSGVIAAVAVLFPRIVVYLYGILPIPMIVLGAIFLFGSITGFFGGDNAGGEAAHLTGMATGVFYVFSQRWRGRLKLKIKAVAWQKKMTEHKNLEQELDRILEKVHKSGIHSLTSKEKRTLKQASKTNQQQDNS